MCYDDDDDCDNDYDIHILILTPPLPPLSLQVPNVAWQSFLQLGLEFPPYILGITVTIGKCMCMCVCVHVVV